MEKVFQWAKRSDGLSLPELEPEPEPEPGSAQGDGAETRSPDQAMAQAVHAAFHHDDDHDSGDLGFLQRGKSSPSSAALRRQHAATSVLLRRSAARHSIANDVQHKDNPLAGAVQVRRCRSSLCRRFF